MLNRRENSISRTVTLADMGQARLITTRSAFKNYLAVINTRPGTVQTIFSVKGLTGPYTEASVSGCGDINPLQNDPGFRVIGPGTRILLNGGTGLCHGNGHPEQQGETQYRGIRGHACHDPGDDGRVCDLHWVPSATPRLPSRFPCWTIRSLTVSASRTTASRCPLPMSRTAYPLPLPVMRMSGMARIPLSSSPAMPASSAIPARLHRSAPRVRSSPQEGIDPLACVNCGTCVRECPGKCLLREPRVAARWHKKSPDNPPPVGPCPGTAAVRAPENPDP